MTAVGFIGLGQIGAPMAGHLVDWPGGLVVCDVRPEATAPFAERGAVVAPTPADVARQADVISVMVFDDAQVRDVLLGADGIVSAGRGGIVVAVHSTIRDSTAEALAAECAPAGIAVVDAPVTGGFMGAHEGRLAVLIGGDPDAVERCREPFGRWAQEFLPVGEVGAGTRAKVARNLITMIGYAGVFEGQRLAEAAAIDLTVLAKAVRHSDGVTGGPGAIMLRDTTAPVDPRDGWYDVLRHTRDLGEKDLALALELGERLGIDLPIGRLARDRFADGIGVPHDEEEPARG